MIKINKLCNKLLQITNEQALKFKHEKDYTKLYETFNELKKLYNNNNYRLYNYYSDESNIDLIGNKLDNNESFFYLNDNKFILEDINDNEISIVDINYLTKDSKYEVHIYTMFYLENGEKKYIYNIDNISYNDDNDHIVLHKNKLILIDKNKLEKNDYILNEKSINDNKKDIEKAIIELSKKYNSNKYKLIEMIDKTNYSDEYKKELQNIVKDQK